MPGHEGNRMARYKNKRRWPRFVAYLPVQCAVLEPGRTEHRQLAGTTLNVGAGGIALLLGETLPLGIPIVITLCRDEPIRGHVVWTDRRMMTFLKTAVPHGVAFENPVDASWVQKWVSQGRRRAHVRAPVLLDVEFTPAGTDMRPLSVLRDPLLDPRRINRLLESHSVWDGGLEEGQHTSVSPNDVSPDRLVTTKSDHDWNPEGEGLAQ